MQIHASCEQTALPVLSEALACLACAQSARLRPALQCAVAAAAKLPGAQDTCARLDAAIISGLLPWLHTTTTASHARY